MSLINKMLQDLEKRGPENETETMPFGVSSAHPEKRNRLPVLAFAGLALLGAGGLAFYFSGKPDAPAPQLVVAAAPTVAPVVETAPAAQTPPVTEPVVAPAAPAPMPAATQPEPSAKVLATERKKETKQEKKKREREEAKAKPKEKLVAKPKANNGKIDKTPVQTEAQEMAEALYRQAAASFGQGRSNESMEKLRQSIALDPAHASARQLLAKLLLENRSYEEARGLLRDGVKQQPAQLQWATILARLELNRGDANAARQALDASIGFAANSADYQSLAGAVAQRQGKPADAAEFYRSALRVKPADGRSWVGLGLALEAEGHPAEAKEAFRRALGTDSLSPELEGLAQRKSR